MWKALLARTGSGGMDLNIEMGVAYDQMFGLYDRATEWTPLKWIAQHPAEDPWKRLGRYVLIEDYMRFGLKEFMSLNEYLKAPFPIAQSVLQVAKEQLKIRTGEQETEEDKLRQEEERLKRGL